MIPVAHWIKIKARPSRSMSKTVGKLNQWHLTGDFLSPFSSTDQAHNSKIAKALKGCQHYLKGLSDPTVQRSLSTSTSSAISIVQLLHVFCEKNPSQIIMDSRSCTPSAKFYAILAHFPSSILRTPSYKIPYWY